VLLFDKHLESQVEGTPEIQQICHHLLPTVVQLDLIVRRSLARKLYNVFRIEQFLFD
jgi:hypothetical protein